MYLIFSLSPTCSEDYLFYKKLLQSCILQMLHSHLRLCNLNSAPAFGQSLSLKVLNLAIELCFVSAYLLRMKVTELLQAVVQTFLNVQKDPLYLLKSQRASCGFSGSVYRTCFHGEIWKCRVFLSFLVQTNCSDQPYQVVQAFHWSLLQARPSVFLDSSPACCVGGIIRPGDHLLCGFQTQES